MQLIRYGILLLFCCGCLAACANPDISRDKSKTLTDLGRSQKTRIDEGELLAKDVLPANVSTDELRRREMVGKRSEAPVKLPLTKPLKSIDYPINLRLDSTKLDSVLRLFARTAGYSLVLSSGVQNSPSTISFNLQGVPWLNAYTLVQEQAKVITVFEDSYKLMRVYTLEEYARLTDAIIAEAKQSSLQVDEFRRLSTIDPLAPKNIDRFYLNYIEPEIASAELKTTLATLYSVKAEDTEFLPTIIEDKDPASLIIRGTTRQLNEVENLLAQIDVLPRQVIIEAFFVEVTDSFERELGVRLSGNPGGDGTFGSVADFNVGDAPDNQLFNFLPTGAGTAFTVVKGIGSNYLRLQLQALENDGFSRTVSSPKILTTSGETGSISRDLTTFYRGEDTVVNTGNTSEVIRGSVESETAGLALSIKPDVVGEYVHLEIDLNNNSFVGEPGGDVPPDKSQVTVTIPKLILRSGEIVVIGGVSSDNEDTDDVQTPFLGDIPLLGRLFKKQRDASTNTQLLVFIAPRVI